ncbi:MAG: dihydropyrimidinase [Candidatus Heimdallarchaeota archaeon]|nr:MAG: dihydropyrimidinase [Candidatus Heimdallarchaeota archaeon]
MSKFIIRNGLLVTDTKQYKADIRIAGEKIFEIGTNLLKSGDIDREIDAKGLLVLPGGIDPHVHLSLPDYIPKEFRWSDDFESGSKAALAGGITTLGCISVPDKEETPLGTLERESKTIQKEAIADIMIHPVLFNLTDEKLAEIPLLSEKGCSTIKIFMVTDDFDANSGEYLKAIQAAKDAEMLTMIHCEDNTIIKETCEKMIAEGKGSLKYYADCRPVKSEVVATQKAVAICEETGAPIYVVHLSSEGALKVCEEAQKRSLPVYVEGRPIFLYLTREEYLKPEGALYVVQPPLREKSDVKALWKGVQQGSIHTIATDHAPHTREQKLNPDLNISKLVPGINELQVMLPMLHSKAVLKGKISLEKFVALTSTNVAKLFGLYPRKGAIQVGSDADLVIWDPKEERVIKDADMHSQAGFSMYNGQKHTGWPQIVIRRGEVVYKDRKIIAQSGTGEVLQRGKTQNPNK